MIEAHGLTKRFGSTVGPRRLDLRCRRIDPRRPRPERRRQDHRGAHPHHAGAARRGSARVAGHDVVARPAAVQRNIGVTAQDATLDEVLTGRRTS
jgi:hypothetical protein